MDETGQTQGWWLASDGNWYPPEQHPDVVSAAVSVPTTEPAQVPGAVQGPEKQGLSKGASIFIGLAVILVLGVGAVGGARFVMGGKSGSHFSSGTKSAMVQGCVSDGDGNEKSCKCFVDELEHAGVKESDLVELGSYDSNPLAAMQSDAMGPSIAAIGKCGLSSSSSSSSSSSDPFGLSGWDR